MEIWIPAVGAVLAALVAGVVALWVRRKNQRLEEARLELERAKQRWERERQELLWQREDRAKQAEREAVEAERQRIEAARAARIAADERGLEEKAEGYRRRLIAELSQLKILDMSRPLDLRRVYVQVRVREQAPARYRDETSGPDDEARVRDPAREAAEAVRPAAPARTTPPAEALGTLRRIVVLGDPGAGKTTMLRHLAYVMADGSAPELPDLPAFVELRDFVDSGEQDLLRYVTTRWADYYGFTVDGEYLAERLLHGRTALLLDGLDEVLGGDDAEEAQRAYALVAREVTRLATRFPEAPMAVTCRRHGWTGGLPAFSVLEALDFEAAQVEAFVGNWFHADPRRAAQLGGVLRKNSRLMTLAANPLLLSLIAIVFERDLELPERRAALYRRCVEVMLTEWDSRRGIKRYARFTSDRKQDLLREIAWRYHLTGRRHLRRDDLETTVAEFLPSVGLPADAAAAVIDEIAAQYGLLKEQSAGSYGFLHLTMQEYFASLAALERDDGVAAVTARRHDPWWEEVLLLMAGATGDASSLIRAVRGEQDDLFRNDLLLAGRCLAAARRVADAGLREGVRAELMDFLRTAEHALDMDRAAAVLVELAAAGDGYEALLGVFSDDAEPGVPAAVAIACGRTADPALAPRLAALLVPGAPWTTAVLQALGELGNDAVAPAVRSAFAALSIEQQPQVLVSVARLGVLYESDFVRHLQADSWRRQRAVDATPFVDLSPETVEEIRTLALGAGTGVFDRADYVRCLHLIEPDATLPAILAALADPAYDAVDRFSLSYSLEGLPPTGFGDAQRTAMLELAASSSWDVAWTVLALLDDHPGDPEPLRALLRSAPSAQVGVAAAATLAAWGFPDDLGLLERAILEEIVDPELKVSRGTNSWTRSGQVWSRLADLLARYGARSAADVAADRAVSRHADPSGPEYFAVLGRLDPPRAVRLFAENIVFFSSMRGLRAYPFDDVVQRAPDAALSVLPAVVATLTPFHDVSAMVGELARSASSDALPVLLALDLDEDRSAVHEAVYEISRRERVRVFADGRVVPDAG